MKKIEYSAQFCVVGGGLAGLCAAISAARHGVKTVLMHDRSVLGGNASSEIRMWVCGAHGEDNRETGIIEEIQLENFYQNPAHKYSIWDSVLYEKAILEPNLKLILNCTCLHAETENNNIKSVTGWQLNSQTFYTVTADYFADCSGDSILAPLTGAEYMYGREAKSEFNETIPPDVADKKTMGMSCLFQIRETDHKTTFTPPSWAYTYETDDDLPMASHDKNTNFWWIELGGTKDCIHDTDECRDELLKIVYGVWDHMKNKGDHDVDNWELEWIGFLPGKRESRRYKGAHIITQNDVEAGGKFDDTVAYAGWTMDDHFPEGFYYKGGHPTIYHPAPSPWGIGFKSLYSCNIKNLLFAGRNISVTHAALSSCRVMATCALLGQAVGTAVAVMEEDSSVPETIDTDKLQNYLMDDDCYIPGKQRKISPLSKKAVCSAPIVMNGFERKKENMWCSEKAEAIEYTFSQPEFVSKIRLVFDSDLNRDYQNMPCNYKLYEKSFVLPSTLITEYKIEITDEKGNINVLSVENNHQRFVMHEVNQKAVSFKFIPIKTNGSRTYNLFDFELI
ncbi:MAG: FAD-dependent oxidoreductase [Clostridia bacterium]|nr:FAD-dependent oxidoreductase [Clostridia bacterium]